jgi:hypothetical protein
LRTAGEERFAALTKQGATMTEREILEATAAGIAVNETNVDSEPARVPLGWTTGEG